MSTSPPATLGKYQIIREIARSNDIVYEAYDPLMNRRVAIKELNVPNGTTPQQTEERVRRFQREVKAAGSLAHPNIVTIYEVGEDQSRHFMAMEYLNGRTLRNELDTHGFLPTEQALEIAVEVLHGLGFAHAHGVVHRDVKPDNIQLLDDGRIKITDFGIARLIFEPNLTMDGQVFGTPSYMSPEQVVGKEIDARSDVFSVGVVLYEMLTGQKPFAGDSVVSITYAIMNTEPRAPSQVSGPVWAALAKALDKNPALRFSGCAQFSEALQLAEKEASLPPPQIDPYAYPTPNSYPASMPFAAPYGPNAPIPTPPPANYTYNPYVGSPPQPGANLPQLLPMFFPPPPPRPLLKPETKRFLSQLLLTCLIVGALFALIIVGVQQISSAFERSRTQRSDAAVRKQIARDIGSLPIEQRIIRREDAIRRLSGADQRQEETRNLAADYEALGNQQRAEGAFEQAQTSYLRAVNLDAENPAYYTDLASLAEAQGKLSPTPEERANYWIISASRWAEAADRSASSPKLSAYRAATVRAYLQAAFERQMLGDFQGERALLDVALQYAEPGTPERAAVESALGGR